MARRREHEGAARGGYDAVFVGSGAPRGRDLDLPGRKEAAAYIHVGIDWLASVAFGHVERIGSRVIVLGGGNTAMDCCRTSRRLGGEDVKVIVRSGFAEMKASPWEKEDALHEGIPILDHLVPKAFTHQAGRLTGVLFEKVRADVRRQGRRDLVPTGEPDLHLACDEVLIAVGQENAFPWIERDLGIEFDRRGLPKIDPVTMRSTHPKVFFGGDAAFGPKNIIWAVAHGHEAAVSIDRFCRGEDTRHRPPPHVNLASQKMGIHEWSYDNAVSPDRRYRVPQVGNVVALNSLKVEVELGFDRELGWLEARRCLNCDVQTVFTRELCIECDACVDICPTDCITFTANGPEPELRARLNAPAPNPAQDLYVSAPVKTGRVMVKDEDVCLHCGLCAERCPTGAWDMRKFLLEPAQAGPPHAAAADRDQRLRRQVRQRERLGLGERQPALRQVHPADGRAGRLAQHLPVQHPGPADLVRGAGLRGGLAGAARRGRPDGRDEPADLGQGPRRDRAGRLPAPRLDPARLPSKFPQRRHGRRHAADRDLQPRLRGPAAAPAVQEHRLRRRARGPARHRPGGGRAAHRAAVQGQGPADRAQPAGAAPGPGPRAGAPGRVLPAPGPPLRPGGRADPDRRQQRGGAGLRLWRRDGGGVVPDHAVDLAGGSLRPALPPLPRRPRNRQEPLRDRPGRGRARRHRHGDRRGLERRPRLHRDLRAGHLADAGVPRPRLLRRDPGRHLRRPARRPVDRHADPHAAVGHPRLRLRQPRRHQARPAVPRGPEGVLRVRRDRVRPRRPAADAGLRPGRPRHRHERLALRAARVGRSPASTTAAS